MLDRLVFYNHFGAGDLFESREFIKEIMQKIPAEQYFYAHGKSPRMFADIPNLEYSQVSEIMNGVAPYVKDNNNLYINTWIGRDGKYVLPQVGCIIDRNYEMFNDIIFDLGYGLLDKSLYEYLPQVDFSKFEINSVDDFVKSNSTTQKILLCNGWVGSEQAKNFDFTPMITFIAEKNPDKLFLVTQELDEWADNIIFTSDITKTSDGFDLNEISYLAKFVDVIIGRKSGPFVFAHNKEVWYDGSKKSLSFTYAKHSSHFVLSDELPLQKFWSPATDFQGVVDKIGEVIG